MEKKHRLTPENENKREQTKPNLQNRVRLSDESTDVGGWQSRQRLRNSLYIKKIRIRSYRRCYYVEIQYEHRKVRTFFNCSLPPSSSSNGSLMSHNYVTTNIIYIYIVRVILYERCWKDNSPMLNRQSRATTVHRRKKNTRPTVRWNTSVRAFANVVRFARRTSRATVGDGKCAASRCRSQGTGHVVGDNSSSSKCMYLAKSESN